MHEALRTARARLSTIHLSEDRGHASSSWIFLRALGAIYAAAFLSLHVQVAGLLGERGILPAASLLERAHRLLGAEAYLRLPSVFWLTGASDATLRAITL